MKRFTAFAIVSIFLLLFFSCHHSRLTQWPQVDVNNNLQHPFFNTAHTKYPWFMIKNDDGTWSSALADSTGRELIDTTKIPVHAQVIVNSDPIFNLDEISWNKRSENDTLRIQLDCFNAAYSGSLAIHVYKNKYDCRFSQDLIYPTEHINWRTLEQQLVLNQKKPEIGKELRGSIRYTCEQTITRYTLEADKARKLETWKDTIRMEGVFRIPNLQLTKPEGR